MSNTNGKLIIIVAASGTGKTTLIKKIKEEFPILKESISCTTRPLRDGEENGVQYHFLTKEDFIKRRDSGDFLEWAEVHSNYYGTSKEFVEGMLSAGNNILFDIDVQGADSLKEYFKDRAQAIFIAPPSLEELKKRLIGRGTDSDDVINVRLSNAKSEILRKDDYDHLVINDELDRAYVDLSAVFRKILKE